MRETSFNDANEHLGRLANLFQFMTNDENKKEKLFKEILRIERFEDRQIMDATKILTSDSTKLHSFCILRGID